MKNTTLDFVPRFGISLGIAIFFVAVGAITTAKAQANIPNISQSTLNGLFTPTAADRFFEEGRRNLERESEILNHPERYSREDILQFNSVDITIIDETGEKIPISDFLEDNPQQELDQN